MASIWLITSGSYSDYGVVCAFRTKEEAEKYPATYGNHHMVEEVVLYESCPPPKEYISLNAEWDLAGQCREWDRSETTPYEMGEKTTWPPGKYPGGNLLAVVRVGSTDQERARKVYSEQRAAMQLKVEQYLAAIGR